MRLFRQLFRGREDLYPMRFVSAKAGKPGYAPVCSNKFVAGLCQLPKVKCGDCSNQAFRPVDDGAVLRHLRGEHVMGVYPMLPDDTCWFLAADFDKSTWQEDVRSFVETARNLGLPTLVERSRSGNGAHVWFFFSEPVAAATARKMGCHLITAAMASRHELSMDSYDRLFPSQDTMPSGGFGNLIALPLQHGPRQAGNSVFLDESLNAYADDQQWSVLASVQRIAPATVERIALEATRAGTVIGVRIAETAAAAEEATPWRRPPSGTPRVRRVPGPMPARVSSVLAQRLFIEKEDVPSALLNQIKRLAAFQNPEFYKKQSMRLSTAMTPRVIPCAEDLPKHIALPRGCRVALGELLRIHGVVLDVVDERVAGAPLQLQFQGKLTEVQESAAQALLAHDTGVFVAPPGVGKTVVGAYLVASRACSTLILVHRRPLLDQWLAQLALFLGVDRKQIGQARPGKPELLTVIANPTEQTIIDTIEKAATKTPFVVVDLEGTASMMVGYAMSRADLVIIPVQGSHLDAAEAVKAISLVQAQERAFRRTIPYAVLFTRTNPVIRARTFQSVEAQFMERKIPILNSQIHEREAYRAIFSFGGTLNKLDPNQVPNIAAAKANAVLFASEVIKLLKAGKAASPEATQTEMA